MKQAMNYLKLAAIYLMAITFISCGDGFRNCVKGDGHYVSQTRIVSDPFIGIELDGSFNVHVAPDTVQGIIVEADSNLLPYIITRVRSNRLLIDSDKKCFRTKKSINIYVTMPETRQLIHDGSGKLECEEMITDIADVELNGSGEIYVEFIQTNDVNIILDGSGSIKVDEIDTYNNLEVLHDGSGSVDVDRLTAYELFVDLDGSGQVNIYDIYTDYASATLKGSGSIELEGDVGYEGNVGHADFKITGSGNIDAFRLYEDVCDAYISGSGSIYVFVIDELYADIPGSGIIYYKGNPQVFYTGSTPRDQVIPVN